MTATDAPELVEDVDGLRGFVAEVLAFLEANAQRRPEQTPTGWGEGDDTIPLFVHGDEASQVEGLAAARRWQATKFDAGFAWITGPKEFGGRELGAVELRTFREMEAAFDLPSTSALSVGLGIVGPTIEHAGTPVVRDRYLRSIYRGDAIACQLFSEPGAGSDLASVRTSAERDGDAWRLSGQKVWTSNAKESQIGLALCRTDASTLRHQGLTMFLVEMDAPGVEIRPLRQMTGGAHFNEVFLDGVVVGDDHRLGEVGEGWAIATQTLMHERASVGGGANGLLEVVSTEHLLALVRHLGRSGDPVIRQALAKLHIGLTVARLTNERILAGVAPGEVPGPELSMSKVAYARNMRAAADFVAAVLGPRAVADSGEWGTYAWASLILGAPALRILGGTEEIMKNILGERVLGLPREPKPPAGG